MELYGLATINIELTNKCNKACWMCGRRRIEKEYPEVVKQYGSMDMLLVERISKQLPPGIIVQFHNNGESLMHPSFGDCVKLFDKQIKNTVTNGKLLLDKFDEIVDNLDTIAVSVFEKDVEAEEQYKTVKEFVAKKGDRKPYVIIRRNGRIDVKRYEDLNLLVANRVLHSPYGSFQYKRKQPTIPECGICYDFLQHPAINIKGDVSICVRFDPNGKGILGNINDSTLEEIWNGEKRLEWLEFHKSGVRQKIALCSTCEFWGIPTGE
jgi:MoaA/NifB/PqqE/SkfB family radical SAM enzyme